jgi:hypothetical protein
LREELGSEVDLHCAVGVAPLHPAGLAEEEDAVTMAPAEAAGAAGLAGVAAVAGAAAGAAGVGREAVGAAGMAEAAGPTGTAPTGMAGALAATIVARMDPRTTLREGDRARVHVDLAALHFFDPDTGASLRSAAAR